jgi:putative flippase GtrA
MAPGRLKLRSLSVSLASTAVDAGLFCLCTLLLAGGTALLIARWVCGAFGAVSNFVLNRCWAFRERRANLWRQAGRYALTALLAVSLASGVWWLLRLATGWDPRLLHLGSLALVWLSFTFPLMRRWVFRSVTPHC